MDISDDESVDGDVFMAMATVAKGINYVKYSAVGAFLPPPQYDSSRGDLQMVLGQDNYLYLYSIEDSLLLPIVSVPVFDNLSGIATIRPTNGDGATRSDILALVTLNGMLYLAEFDWLDHSKRLSATFRVLMKLQVMGPAMDLNSTPMSVSSSVLRFSPLHVVSNFHCIEAAGKSGNLVFPCLCISTVESQVSFYAILHSDGNITLELLGTSSEILRLLNINRSIVLSACFVDWNVVALLLDVFEATDANRRGKMLISVEIGNIDAESGGYVRFKSGESTQEIIYGKEVGNVDASGTEESDFYSLAPIPFPSQCVILLGDGELCVHSLGGLPLYLKESTGLAEVGRILLEKSLLLDKPQLFSSWSFQYDAGGDILCDMFFGLEDGGVLVSSFENSAIEGKYSAEFRGCESATPLPRADEIISIKEHLVLFGELCDGMVLTRHGNTLERMELVPNFSPLADVSLFKHSHKFCCLSSGKVFSLDYEGVAEMDAAEIFVSEALFTSALGIIPVEFDMDSDREDSRSSGSIAISFVNGTRLLSIGSDGGLRDVTGDGIDSSVPTVGMYALTGAPIALQVHRKGCVMFSPLGNTETGKGELCSWKCAGSVDSSCFSSNSGRLFLTCGTVGDAIVHSVVALSISSSSSVDGNFQISQLSIATVEDDVSSIAVVNIGDSEDLLVIGTYEPSLIFFYVTEKEFTRIDSLTLGDATSESLGRGSIPNSIFPLPVRKGELSDMEISVQKGILFSLVVGMRDGNLLVVAMSFEIGDSVLVSKQSVWSLEIGHLPIKLRYIPKRDEVLAVSDGIGIVSLTDHQLGLDRIRPFTYAAVPIDSDVVDSSALSLQGKELLFVLAEGRIRVLELVQHTVKGLLQSSLGASLMCKVPGNFNRVLGCEDIPKQVCICNSDKTVVFSVMKNETKSYEVFYAKMDEKWEPKLIFEIPGNFRHHLVEYRSSLRDSRVVVLHVVMLDQFEVYVTEIDLSSPSSIEKLQRLPEEFLEFVASGSVNETSATIVIPFQYDFQDYSGKTTGEYLLLGSEKGIALASLSPIQHVAISSEIVDITAMAIHAPHFCVCDGRGFLHYGQIVALEGSRTLDFDVNLKSPMAKEYVSLTMLNPNLCACGDLYGSLFILRIAESIEEVAYISLHETIHRSFSLVEDSFKRGHFTPAQVKLDPGLSLLRDKHGKVIVAVSYLGTFYSFFEIKKKQYFILKRLTDAMETIASRREIDNLPMLCTDLNSARGEFGVWKNVADLDYLVQFLFMSEEVQELLAYSVGLDRITLLNLMDSLTRRYLRA